MSGEQRRWQFSIRDVLLIMLIVGLAVGWFVDHRRLADELERQRSQANVLWLGNTKPVNPYWSTLQNVTGSITFTSPTTPNPLQPDPTITDPPAELPTP